MWVLYFSKQTKVCQRRSLFHHNQETHPALAPPAHGRGGALVPQSRRASILVALAERASRNRHRGGSGGHVFFVVGKFEVFLLLFLFEQQSNRAKRKKSLQEQRASAISLELEARARRAEDRGRSIRIGSKRRVARGLGRERHGVWKEEGGNSTQRK